MAERWITIGEVRDRWYLRGLNQGAPYGLRVYWAGEVFRSYPALPTTRPIRRRAGTEFFYWRALLEEAQWRLLCAGLQAVAFATPTQRERNGYIRLQALVRMETDRQKVWQARELG